MSLSSLTKIFQDQAAADSGNITINAKTFTDANLIPPSDLDTLLTDGYNLGAGISLLIDTTGTEIPEPTDNVLIISGVHADVLNVDKANTDVTLTITATSDDVQFSIVIGLSDWTFSTSWKYMTGGVFDTLPYSSPSFIFSTLAVEEFPYEDQTIELVVGQNFASLIKLTGILESIIEFLSTWVASRVLTFAGRLDPSKIGTEGYIFPDMDLFVPIDDEPISLIFLEVTSPALGFSITSSSETVIVDEESTEIVNQTPFLFFQLTLDAGSDFELDFRTNIDPTGSSFNISATPPEGVSITPLNLFALMAGKNWYDKVPSTLQQYISGIQFLGFGTSLIINDKIPTITSVSAMAGSTKPWTLFPGFEIEEFEVIWAITDPLDTEKINQSLYFSASVNFFKDIFKGGFEVEITSDLFLSAAFEGEVSINNLIDEITKKSIQVPDSIAKVDLTGFGISMDINQKYFSFFANGDVELNLITNVSLTNASMTMSSSTANDGTDKSVYTAGITGLFTISILQLQTEVNYTSGDEGKWNLSLEMPSGDSLNIKELMDDLFGVVDFSLIDTFIPDDLIISHLPGY